LKILHVALTDDMADAVEKLLDDKTLGYEDLSDYVASAIRHEPTYLARFIGRPAQ